MYFLVFSDSHGHAWRMAEAIRLHPEVRQVLFLVDGLRDMREIADGFPFRLCRCDVSAGTVTDWGRMRR